MAEPLELRPIPAEEDTPAIQQAESETRLKFLGDIAGYIYSALSRPPQPKQVITRTEPFGEVTEISRMNNRAADHTTPDAVVHVPLNFDPTKPINLVIYNHGFGSTALSSFRDNRLGQQMANAPDNSILLVPEWQFHPGARSSHQGKFKDQDTFRKMILEAFGDTPALQGKTLNDVANISIFAHSAGYGPTNTELYNNGLEDKVKSITLLDALYDRYMLDPWFKRNIKELAAGTKQFRNFFDGTATYSQDQATRIEQMLSAAHLPASSILKDYNHTHQVMDAATIAKYPIIFKHTTVDVDNLGSSHLSIPRIYLAPVEEAARNMP